MKSRFVLLGLLLVVPVLAFAQGPPHHLTIAPTDTAITAGDTVTFVITVVDSDGVRTPVTQERTLRLIAGEFAPPPGSSMAEMDPFMFSTDIVIPVGLDSATVEYSDTTTNDGAPYHLMVYTIDGLPPGLQGEGSVTVMPAELGSFVWSGIDGNATAGVAENATLEVRDVYGNLLFTYEDSVYLSTTSGEAGDVVEWYKAGAAGDLSNVPGGDSAVYVFHSADNGVANLSVRDEKKENIQLEAVKGAASGTSPVIVVNPASADVLVKVSGDLQTAVVHTPVALPLVVRVEDEFGNPVPGEDVTFTVLSGGGVIDLVSGGGIDSVGTSDSGGEVECEYWLLGDTVAVGDTVQAHMSAGSTPNVEFTATGLPGAGDSIVLTPNGGNNVTIGTYTTVTAELTDQYGNEVPSEQVTILIADPSNGELVSNPADPNPTYPITGTTRYGTTDSTGKITVRHHSSLTAGVVDTVDALSGSVTRADVTDGVYTTVAEGAIKLRILWTAGNSTPAGDAISFTVQAVDGNDNVDTGDTSTVDLTEEIGSSLEFSLTDGGAPVTQVKLVNGEKLLYVWGTKAGTWEITASDNAGSLTAAIDDVIIGDTGTVDHYDVTTVGSVVAGDNFDVAVEAQDEYGNRVTGAGNSIDLVAVYPDSITVTSDLLLIGSAGLVAGQTNVTEQYERAEAIRVRVRDASVNEGFSDVLTVTPAAADRLEYVSGDTTGVVAGDAVPLVAQVLDEFNNPVAGEVVSFAEQTPGCVVTPGSQASGSDGRVTVSLETAQAVGTNRVEATIYDGSLSRWSVDYTVDTEPGLLNYYTIVPDKTTIKAGETTGVTVRAFDQYGNLRTNDNSTVVVLTSSTGNAQYGDDQEPLTAGVYSTTVWDTVKETVTLTVNTQGGGPTADSAPVTVTSADAYEVVKISGDASGVGVGIRQRLWVEVRDVYGYTVPGVTVDFDMVSSPGGSAELRDASGADTTDGVTVSDASGLAWADVLTSLEAGDNVVIAQILNSDPPSLETKTFTVSTVAGGIAYYTVTPGETEVVAGTPVTITVEAYDSNNNLIPDPPDSVVLSLDPAGGLFVPNPVKISGGDATSQLTHTVAGVCSVRAETQGGGVFNYSPSITILPDVPFGTDSITAVAVPPAIPANGSITTITSNAIEDQYGNPVGQGEMITVSTDLGTIVDTDQDPSPGSPGIQVATNTTSQIVFHLQSGSTPGTANVSMQSLAGSATGGISVLFAEPPAIDCQVSPPIPNNVVPGQAVAFKVYVENTSSTGVTLSTATKFEFSDGDGQFFSAALDSPIYIPPAPSAGDTLRFVSMMVDPLMNPGGYQPALKLRGTDSYGATFQNTCLMVSGSLTVSAVEILSITAPEFVIRGDTSEVTVFIRNQGPLNANIASVILKFSGGSYTFGSSPDLPAVIAGGGTSGIRIPVYISSTSNTGLFTINASVSGTVNGIAVSDTSIAPYPLGHWTVRAGATLEYVAGSLFPSEVSQGKDYSVSVSVKNTGDVTVTLDQYATKLSFTDGVLTYEAFLSGATAIAGGATQLLTFLQQTVPGSFIPGNNAYPVDIYLEGLENGGFFSQTVSTADSSEYLSVVTPALLTFEDGSLTPKVVSRFTDVFFTVDFLNSGTAEVILNPDSTRFSFASGAYDAPLNPAGGTTIVPGINTLQFVSREVTVPQNSYVPRVRIVGTENGLPFKENYTLTDTVVVQNAPDVSIQSIAPSQASITRDQTQAITLTMTVKNDGAAAVNFQSASVRFILGGGEITSQFVISTPDSFVGGSQLAGNGALDSIQFTVQDAAGLMSTGNVTIEGMLLVTDDNSGLDIYADTDLGGKGSLLIQTPADLAVLSVIPDQNPVTAGQTNDFTIRMAIENTGESDVDVSLVTPQTILNFGDNAGWVWTLRDTLAGGGTILDGESVDEVLFDVDTTGSTSSPSMSITGVFIGVEMNSGRSVGAGGVGSIEVQSTADIIITSVTPSRPTVTQNFGTYWEILVGVTNNGESDVDLTLPDSLTMSIQDEIAGTSYISDSALQEGGSVLVGGASGTLKIGVTYTGTFVTTGLKTINVRLAGIELNSGNPVSGTGSGGVTVQNRPDVAYVDDSLSPTVVSIGSNVSFRVGLRDTVSDGSTVRFNRALTRFRFGTAPNEFEAALTTTSPDSLTGGESDTLVFNATYIDPAFGTGPQDVRLDLHWQENGANDSKLITLTNALSIQSAPQLSILAIHPSQPTVTVNQPSDSWSITMVVKNNGGTGVNLYLGVASTNLQIKTLAGANVPGYTFQQPFGLEGIGGNTLPAGQQDSLVFNVTSTGSTPGLFIIAGEVRGEDVLSHNMVFDDTYDGGSGNITVQSEAVLRIVSTIPAQATATQGQTTPIEVETRIANDGGSDLNVVLDAAVTGLTFDPDDPLWDWDVKPALGEGGILLPKFAERTVLFNILRVGSTPDTTRIDALVQGFEINTGRGLADNTDDAGSGIIIVQQPAQLVIDSVTTSRTTVTTGSPVDWTITAHVRNPGGSDLMLVLPDSASATINGDGGTSTITPSSQLVGGGTVLERNGDTGQLVFNVTQTGNFSSFGPQDIIVLLVGREENSGVFISAQDTGSVTVQKEPIPEYALGSLDPPSGTIGEMSQYRITLRNSDPDAATIEVESQTKLRFANDQYEAYIESTSPRTLLPADSTEIRFEWKRIASSIPLDTYDIYVDLDYTENGRSRFLPLTLDDKVIIQQPSGLQILELISQEDQVTAGQTKSWDVWMVVKNNGEGPVRIDTASALTALDFVHDPTKVNITDEYTVDLATWLTPNPGSLLPGGPSGGPPDTLLFRIIQTGESTGTVLISGSVEGTDINTTETVDDDWGSETILVQARGELAINSITPSQPTVTRGQTRPCSVRVAIQNVGESDLKVRVDSCSITFSGGAVDDWSYLLPPFIEGGDTILSDGEVGVLVFEVDITATTAMTWDIDAYVEAEEISSGRTDSTSTGTSGFGSIVVQKPPQLRVVSTTIIAPRDSIVNTGQRFPVEVSIENIGQAAAESLLLHIEKTDSSKSELELPTDHVIRSLVDSATTELDTFYVTAGPAQPDTFFVVIDSVYDANSSQTDPTFIAQAVDSAVAYIQEPARLEIVRTVPSQSQITQNQSTSWFDTVVVHNGGQAGLRIKPPVLPWQDDISFSLRGVGDQNDYYNVKLPASLVSGPGSDWFIPGDSTDALIFEITSSGSEPGTLDVFVNLTAEDLNDPDADSLTAVGSTFVVVEEVSGLYISSTEALVPNKQTSPPLAFVNINQEYKMEIVVTNTGEAVRDVEVSLSSDNIETSIAGPDSQYQSIGTEKSATFLFDVKAGPSPYPYETFTAVIESATSVNTGQPVEPAVPSDEAYVETQWPADLSLTLDITSPAGATDDTVSANQLFEITAEVTNEGDAATEGPGRLRLTLSPGFTLDPSTQDTLRDYQAGEQVSWWLRAPDTPVDNQTIACTIDSALIDKNEEKPANISQNRDSVSVTVEREGILESPAVYFVGPEGAKDGILSTEQPCTLQVEVKTSEQTQGIFAAITLPPGFESIGETRKDLGSGTDTSKTAIFPLRAPAFATTSPEQIQVTFTADDENTGDPLPQAEGSTSVEVVRRTRLRLTAEITSPPEATDGTVTIGSSFIIEATVLNEGDAGIIALPPDLIPVLELTPPEGYLVISDPLLKPFSIDTPVTWEITAPSRASVPRTISVSFNSVPADTNSYQEAQVVGGDAIIPVQTEGAVVQVQDVSDRLGFDTQVVPGGATDIDLFAIEIKNPRRESDEPPAQIEEVAITVLDQNGNPLSNPGGTLADLILEIGGERLVMPEPVSNPVLFNVAGMGDVSYIHSTDSTNLAFSVSVKSSPAAGEIRLAIESGNAIIVIDSASTQELDVVDKRTGQPIDEGILSHPLVILSNRFSEYAHNYPNPFHAGSENTRIAYFLNSQSDVTIKIYSLAGNLVYEKVYNRGDPHTQPGAREAEWDGRNMKGETVRNGIYICKIVAGSNSATFRIAVAK